MGSVRVRPFASSGCSDQKFPVKFARMSVDYRSSTVMLTIPLKAGLLESGVRSTYILGLQIGSILSRHDLSELSSQTLCAAEPSSSRIQD